MMQDTIRILNQLVDTAVIGQYAIGGAVAALYYVEMAATEDLDILVSFEDSQTRPMSGLITITPILNALRELGFSDWHKEGILIEGWPVQFLPVASSLDQESLDHAISVDIGTQETGPVWTRILSGEHLIAKAVEISRPKDRLRILQFIEEAKFSPDRLALILDQFDLMEKWVRLCHQLNVHNPIK